MIGLTLEYQQFSFYSNIRNSGTKPVMSFFTIYFYYLFTLHSLWLIAMFGVHSPFTIMITFKWVCVVPIVCLHFYVNIWEINHVLC